MKKEKASFTGKTKRDTKVHIFAQPFGYPIRACMWEIPGEDFIEDDAGKPVTCKRCLSIAEGKVKPMVDFKLPKGRS